MYIDSDGWPRSLGGLAFAACARKCWAVVAYSLVLANAAPSTVHAVAAYSLVFANAAPSTVLAMAALALMLRC